MKKKVIGSSLCILILLIVIVYFKPKPITQTTLFQSSSTSHDILILYKNKNVTALTLTTNTNTTSPILYFDIAYNKIVEYDNHYYLTNDINFLKLNQDGTVEQTETLSTYQTIEMNRIDFNPIQNDSFVYKQKDDSLIVIPYSHFRLENYTIIQMIQIKDYFN